MTRQSVPQSGCIGSKCSVTKSNTPSSWLDESSTIHTWSELPTSSKLKLICDIRWSVSMESFVHKSKNFVINALLDAKLVKFIDEFCSDGIKLAFFFPVLSFLDCKFKFALTCIQIDILTTSCPTPFPLLSIPVCVRTIHTLLFTCKLAIACMRTWAHIVVYAQVGL